MRLLFLYICPKFTIVAKMTKELIKEIHEAITTRGLQGKLKERLQVIRPGISANTIMRAWDVVDFAAAPAALRLVLYEARFVKEADDVRIAEELAKLEAEAA